MYMCLCRANSLLLEEQRDRRGRDRMVVAFTSAISAYHH
jgi:hypothetical protein